MFLIHCCLSPSDITLNSTKLFCFKTYPYLYGKTFWLVSFFIFTILITSFSQYTTICFVSFVYSVFNEHFFKCRIQNAECKMNSTGGDDGIRTHDPLLAGQVLSQLSYTPIIDCRMLNAECRIIRFCCSPFQPSRSEDFTFRLVKNFIRLRISLLTKSKISSQALSCLVGPSGLEPPTSCLSGTRSNLLSYEPMWLVSDFLSHLVASFILHSAFWILHSTRGSFRFLGRVGIELSSRAASSKVFSPLQSLTSVFGMGTGGPSAFVTPTTQ